MRSHPLQFIPTPSAKEQGITFHPGIGIAYVTKIRSRHSEPVDRALVSRNSVPGPKFTAENSPRSVCISTPIVIPVGYDADICSPDDRNRLQGPNSESALPPGRHKVAFGDFRSGAQIPLRERGACVLVHRLSYPLGTTRLFVRPVIGTAREAPIQNRHFDPVGTRLHLEIFDPAPKFLSESVVAGCRYHRIRTPLRPNEYNFPLSY
ncbi:hypothetical protein Taro_026591 [Colocasia esculenta]|uniref:Uncharacterized protein n=1 Tax=Colocasia esculenta TaxID=4460 RepID=A0A843VBT4_COLES|nr:hypothetical protein [Colocasia esculenta]